MAIATDSSTIWKEYQEWQSYMEGMGFSKNWPEFIRFIEGKQWPEPTEKTKYMPRPVINQCDFIIENKQSNILSQSIKMIYSPEELPSGDNEQATADQLNQASQDMSDAAKNTWDDIEQDALNEELVNDTLSIGAGILHYYFDNSLKGGVFTPYVGKIQGEVIDPMSVILGNPKLKASQTQKQPWIMIETQEDTETLQEQAKNTGSNWQLIQSDEKSREKKYDSDKQEPQSSKRTTALTKYYREKDGSIWWTKVTESAVVQKPRPLKPDDIELEDGRRIQSKPFTLYPIEILVFKSRRKCTFGRSVIEDIIPNQKALNFGLGMMLLSVQQTAWPKIITKMGALMQSITNEPGEILTDHSGQAGVDGIKYMQPPNFSTTPIMLAEKLLDMTRQVTGTTEVTSGEMIGANMAASAIIALQNQAKKPNEGYQNKLFRSMKRSGRIWEEFYKVYYNMPRPISTTDEDGNQETRQFTGTDYADMGFGLKIDVGPASVFSESLQMTVLDKMHDKGDIDKYQYAKYAPSNVIPSQLKQDFEKEQKQLIEQQQAQQQLQQQQPNLSSIISQLSPEEQAILKQHPELLQQVMGGVANGPMPTVPAQR